MIDLRHEAGYPLSAPLLRELGRVAENGGKAILLLNRRGVAPALHCRACGTTPRCPLCDVSLVLHADGRLHCHHCGFAEPAPQAVPRVRLVRARAARRRHAAARARARGGAARARADPARRGHRRRSRSARRGARAVRRDRPGRARSARRWSRRAITSAASRWRPSSTPTPASALPDFRAEERTFQLLTQLAGRSGRDAPGRVLIQTFQPDARADRARRAPRRRPGSSPASSSGGASSATRRSGTSCGSSSRGPTPGTVERALGELRGGLDGAELLGPAPLLRLRGRHRAQLVAKTESPRALAARAGRLLAAAAPAMRRAGLTAVVDVDPQSL